MAAMDYPDLDRYERRAREELKDALAENVWRPGVPIESVVASSSDGISYVCMQTDWRHFKCGKCGTEQEIISGECPKCRRTISIIPAWDLHRMTAQQRYDEVLQRLFEERRCRSQSPP